MTGTYGHKVTFTCDRYTPVDEALIPTGDITNVAGTPFDLTKPNTGLGQAIAISGGFDHNFCVNGYEGNPDLKPVCKIEEPNSGRALELKTNQPGVQFYTGELSS